jgi:hypothetical protein
MWRKYLPDSACLEGMYDTGQRVNAWEVTPTNERPNVDELLMIRNEN